MESIFTKEQIKEAYKSRVEVSEKSVRIDMGGERFYEFDVNRTDRVRHLSEKTWMDAETVGELIEVVCGHFGWDLFAGC